MNRVVKHEVFRNENNIVALYDDYRLIEINRACLIEKKTCNI